MNDKTKDKEPTPAERIAQLEAENAAQAERIAELEAAPVAEPPAWQDPDYSGPLTADQAAWRNRKIEQARLAEATKPVKGAKTK